MITSIEKSDEDNVFIIGMDHVGGFKGAGFGDTFEYEGKTYRITSSESYFDGKKLSYRVEVVETE